MAKTAKGLTIFQRPNGSWKAQIRKIGFPHESRDFLTYADADDWGMRRLHEMLTTGKLVDRREAERVTLAQAIERYITEVTRQRPKESSIAPEEARLRRFMRNEPAICGHALAYLSPEMFNAWGKRRLTETASRGEAPSAQNPKARGQYKPETVPPGRVRTDGSPRKNAAKPKALPKPAKTISAGTLKREMTILKRVFDFSMTTYKLQSNPMLVNLVQRPSVQDARDVRLTEADWNRLMDECRAASNPWLAPIVEIAVELGGRRGSLLGLRWEDVDLNRASVTLRGVKNSRKPSEVRNVEIGLTPRAIEILQGLARSIDGRVFPIEEAALASAFNRARKRAGLGHFRFHDTRHEMASRLAEAGWGMLEIMAQGDWRDGRSVWRYVKANGQALGAKLALLPRRVGI